MKLRIFTLLAALLCVVGSVTAQKSYQLRSNVDYEEGVVRIKFKEYQTAALDGLMKGERGMEARGAVLRTGIAGMDAVNAAVGATEMHRVFRPAGQFEARHREWGLHLWYEVSYSSNQPLQQVIQAYQGAGEIALVEPKEEYRLVDGYEPMVAREKAMTNADMMTIPGGTPNDPSYSQQWGYPAINAAQAWEIESGLSSVVVAIEDQGVDYNHPDLDGNMWTNSGETPGNGIDDDNNGYVDDYYGYNFGDNTGSIAIDYHGTHVGGTVSAETNNGVGVAGTAGGSGSNDGVRLMSLSVFGASSQGGFDEAFIYAADMGAAISQNSWGGGAQNTALENAIDYFRANGGGGQMNGGLVVFAAGNDNSSSPSIGYPGSYSSCLAVASIASNLVRSSFSNYGSWVDISAPGSAIYSTYPVSQGSYNSISGTSMACPHVSGVAALVLSNKVRNGETITDEQLWDLLVDNADASLYNTNGSYTGQLGSGMVDAYASLTGQTAPPPPPPPCNEGEGDVTLTLITDNYGSETTWTLKDGNGATVASGSGYANNTTYTETFSGLDGQYTFTINDSYGDGICCSYGNGSYELEDANGVVLKSGGSFASSESTDICITPAGGGGGGGSDCSGSAPTSYCAADGGSAQYEWIDLVAISGTSLNNTTGANGGYGDFTSQTGDLVAGNTYTISLSAGFSGTAYDENWKFYADWNRDGDFSDAGEDLGGGTTANATTYTMSMTVPTSASLGDTRFRAVMRWNTAAVACGNSSYGEVEDYTINVCDAGTASVQDVVQGETLDVTQVVERLRVYPNPASEMLTIVVQRMPENGLISITDMMGRRVKTLSAEEISGGVDVSGLRNGMYFIQVQGDGESFTQSFIKQ